MCYWSLVSVCRRQVGLELVYIFVSDLNECFRFTWKPFLCELFIFWTNGIFFIQKSRVEGEVVGSRIGACLSYQWEKEKRKKNAVELILGNFSLSQLLWHKMLVHILWIYLLTCLFGALKSLFQLSRETLYLSSLSNISYAAPIEKKLLSTSQIVLDSTKCKINYIWWGWTVPCGQIEGK